MRVLQTCCSDRVARSIFLLGSLLFPIQINAFGQKASPPQVPSGPTASLSAETNLVVVRVVVRDKNGNPVTGLKREDFRLYDRGKEQELASFEEEPDSISATTSKMASSNPAEPTGNTADASAFSNQRLLAFYFDNLTAPAGSLMQARDAANQFFSTGIQASDRVAIFSSDKMLTDFTSDPKQIQSALKQLNISSHAPQPVRRCPDLSEYQAEELLRNNVYQSSDDAWQLAGAEIKQCSGGDPDPKAPPSKAQIQTILAMARQIVDEANGRTLENLQQFERVIRYVAKLPGSRTVVLVSPGFLSSNEQDQFDRIIDEALRSRVVVNALDPKGLTVMMREMDVTRSATTNGNQAASNAARSLDSGQQFLSQDALVEVTQGTGGRFFHDENDLAAGFNSLAGHADEYTLSFTPKDLKQDGKFHELKVVLASKPKGYSVSARRGYFALSAHPEKSNQPEVAAASVGQPVGSPSTGPATAQNPAGSGANAQGASMDDRIREALLANADSTDLRIGIALKIPHASAAATEADAGKTISLLIHLDVNSLPFRQEGDHSIDTVTFAAAVFDASDKAGAVKQRVARLNITPEQLASLKANGLEVTLSFPVEPGSHRVRAIVAESEQHKIGSLSKSFDLP